MKNAIQLKAQIRNLSKEYKITAQVILQNYMMERLLERITVSPYHSKFVLKGGMLIASMVGLTSRSTMDLDATMQDFDLTEKNIKTAFTEISSIEIDDGIKFSLGKIEEIRESDPYGGFRVYINGSYDTTKTLVKVDLSTGDKITPRAVPYDFKLLMQPRSILIFSYNLETILAEKLETILTRGVLNTRPRDFYDIFVLRQRKIDYPLLSKAVTATSKWRGAESNLANSDATLSTIREDQIMQERWKRYCNDFDYAKGINFHEVIERVAYLLKTISA